MATTLNKRRDGFQGEKLISIPHKVWMDAIKRDEILSKLYITHIGYFPKASNHYRDRRKGCGDNIFFYCLHGTGYCLLDNKKFTIRPNQFIVIPATEKSIRYWADSKDPWTIYWIHFTGKDLKMLNQSLNINLLNGPIDTPFNEKAIEIWENIYQNLEMGYSKENLLNASFCLYHFLITFIYPEKHIIREEHTEDNIITKSILYMRDNLHKKLSVDDLSALHGLSCSHFSSLFRKSSGMPPIDYFIHLKMQKACQMLNLKDSRIRMVALDLGYEDPYYFSRLFKKFIGMSPELYKTTMMSQI